MAIYPVGLLPKSQMDSEIRSVISRLGPDVAHVTYRLDEDSTGDPAIFFRIVLTDSAARKEILFDATQRISNQIFEDLHPIENWGIHPYFSFTSVSEANQTSERNPAA